MTTTLSRWTVAIVVALAVLVGASLAVRRGRDSSRTLIQVVQVADRQVSQVDGPSFVHERERQRQPGVDVEAATGARDERPLRVLQRLEERQLPHDAMIGVPGVAPHLE